MDYLIYNTVFRNECAKKISILEIKNIYLLGVDKWLYEYVIPYMYGAKNMMFQKGENCFCSTALKYAKEYLYPLSIDNIHVNELKGKFDLDFFNHCISNYLHDCDIQYSLKNEIHEFLLKISKIFCFYKYRKVYRIVRREGCCHSFNLEGPTDFEFYGRISNKQISKVENLISEIDTTEAKKLWDNLMCLNKTGRTVEEYKRYINIKLWNI